MILEPLAPNLKTIFLKQGIWNSNQFYKIATKNCLAMFFASSSGKKLICCFFLLSYASFWKAKSCCTTISFFGIVKRLESLDLRFAFLFNSHSSLNLF